MRFFVTGGTGFIGSHFINCALAKGHEIRALRRPNSAPRIYLAQEPEWIQKPLEKVDQDDLAGCDVLIHIAAQGVSPQPTDWITAHEINVLHSIRLIHTAIEAGVPHIIACGSCAEYGSSGTEFDEIPPDAPLRPIGPYASSKAAFSVSFQAMARSFPAAFTLIRPFHLYGEGQHPANFWPALKKAASAGEDFSMTAGEQVRDYQLVTAAAADFLAAAESFPEKKQARVLNIGSGKPVTLREFASEQWKLWEAPGKLIFGAHPYRENEVMRFVPKL